MENNKKKIFFWIGVDFNLFAEKILIFFTNNKFLFYKYLRPLYIYDIFSYLYFNFFLKFKLFFFTQFINIDIKYKIKFFILSKLDMQNLYFV